MFEGKICSLGRSFTSFVTFFILNETLCSVRVGAVSFPFASMITNIQARVRFVNKFEFDKY
jgi:hypothetical protein